MPYTAEQRKIAQCAALRGYKQNVMENSIPAAELAVGDGVIVLTEKGEPIMTGKIEAVEGEVPSFRIGTEWYPSSQYSFRRI